jgi:hypothetical protein
MIEVAEFGGDDTEDVSEVEWRRRGNGHIQEQGARPGELKEGEAELKEKELERRQECLAPG